MSRFVAAACQLDSRDDKAANVERALGLLDEAAADGADFVAFPEMTTFIGPEERFAEVAEALDGPTIQRFSEKAREHGVFVHTGSFFERIPDSDRVYNTSALIGPSGEVLDTYRKVHLFDIELDGSVEHRESDYVAPGDRPVTVDTDLATFGLSICYDLRFPGLYRAMAQSGANVLLVPSAFTMHTGKDHWEPLLRARAIENQAYVIAPGQIGDKPSWVETYGRTLVVDPWGNVISKARDREEVVTATIDLSHLDDIRRDMQTLQHARPDVYERSEK
ncbi:carbon-nitrogen hydrolase family protein [Haloferax volcanii]|uniref:Carbon-nitrogen hydrolase family protein n=3 Tax=Haloferax volcanii TaxID=2246 RepID=A0A6C0URX1_HALVO|nr:MULTISPECIES: carbon-nitrogen hydrolase family protein [Haloferax]ELZ77563.1 Carbon-nitrogen hydrolase [Haloferax lucentense DSM 14919]ELZ95687.1 Carbon-nitrogen hydrolase [Haloferax alexandrinus JCM 10717]NLV03153.1 carbon-nitrogen hydrolase family protein [Haloferax alexandrinus]QIB77957.1 carbon-nitrogen hydrolase family protein [Haloferax alexandrinus]